MQQHRTLKLPLVRPPSPQHQFQTLGGAIVPNIPAPIVPGDPHVLPDGPWVTFSARMQAEVCGLLAIGKLQPERYTEVRWTPLTGCVCWCLMSSVLRLLRPWAG